MRCPQPDTLQTPPNMEEQPPPIFIPDQWSSAAVAISASSRPSVVFICGAKNSGKSTFSLVLLNSLLAAHPRVAYLDADVGQPAFTTPGSLSLHILSDPPPDSAAVLSMKTPERCFFFGDTSTKRDPHAYLQCIFQLYDYYEKSQKQVPLIINTPGWIKGVGYNVLVEMINHVLPTHVVQIRIPVEGKNLPLGAFWLDELRECSLPHSLLIYLAGARHDNANRPVLTQKDGRRMRDARLNAYFRQCFGKELNINTNKELAHALTSMPPYEVSLSQVKVQQLHCRVPGHEMYHSLNATIVGLGVSANGGGSEVDGGGSSIPWCVGLGLVRGVDASKGIVYVITPVPLRCLEKVDVLLQGFIEIPTCLLQVRGCVSPYMSTNVLSMHSGRI